MLDGLRALFVFTVMAYHGGLPVPGDLGVSAFFVLSGFLITWLLLDEQAQVGRISLRDFYARRTLRIFPAYYVFIGGSLLFDSLRGFTWPHGLPLAAATYTVNYFNASHGHPSTGIAHAWSLAVEEQFYLLWPLAFMALSRRGTKVTVQALVCTIGAVALWRSFVFLQLHSGTAYPYNAFETRADALLIGCLLAVVLRARADAIEMAWHRWWMPLLTIGAIVLSRLAPDPYQFSIGMTANALMIAMLIVQVLRENTHPAWRWMDSAIVTYLGRISYPLYLYHMLGISLAVRLTHGAPMGVRLLLGLAMSIVLASGSYFVVERPFLALKRRFSRAQVPAPVAAAVQLPPGAGLPGAPAPRRIFADLPQA